MKALITAISMVILMMILLDNQAHQKTLQENPHHTNVTPGFPDEEKPISKTTISAEESLPVQDEIVNTGKPEISTAFSGKITIGISII